MPEPEEEQASIEKARAEFQRHQEGVQKAQEARERLAEQAKEKIAAQPPPSHQLGAEPTIPKGPQEVPVAAEAIKAEQKFIQRQQQQESSQQRVQEAAQQRAEERKGRLEEIKFPGGTPEELERNKAASMANVQMATTPLENKLFPGLEDVTEKFGGGGDTQETNQLLSSMIEILRNIEQKLGFS